MIHIEIKGLERVTRKLSRDLIAGPLRTFFKKAAITVQSEVRNRTPQDIGKLVNSINYSIDDGALPLWAKIGPDAKPGSALWFQARAMEFGTGRMGQPGVSHKSKHWPPSVALDVWARRHGFESGAQVARIIGKRGGLRPRKFMQEGFKAIIGASRGLVTRLGDEIQAAWNRRI